MKIARPGRRALIGQVVPETFGSETVMSVTGGVDTLCAVDGRGGGRYTPGAVLIWGCMG
jgi:hypothetical protein